MEENEISKSNKIKIIVITALIFLVSIAGISYAYFTIQIVGNDTASSMRLRTANMSLVYNDVQIVSGEYAQPGWTQTKTLTVTNTGNVTATYNLVWRDLLNEIVNDELVISATCSASSGSCSAIPETAVPTYVTETHNVGVTLGIQIAPGVTHTYTLTALFKEIGSNQNYNQNKYFEGTLNIEEYSLKRNGTDSTTGLPVVRLGSEEFYDLTSTVDYDSLINTYGNIYNYAADKSILFAKYNLYVGRICVSSEVCFVISQQESNYGLQSINAKGYIDSLTPSIGAVPFWGANESSNVPGYWYDSTNNTVKSQYGNDWYGNNIYDSNYVGTPDSNNMHTLYNENYSIAYYVEEYVDRLGINGVGRLLTWTESNSMTQTQRANGARYWLGTAHSYTNMTVRRANNVGSTGGSGYSDFFDYGARPVIVVNTFDIES